jgi:hypothetical protein
MKTIIFILFFLLVGAFFIISNEQIKLNSAENIDMFFLSYARWVDSLLDNTKVVTGYVVKMEWLPGEDLVEE